MCIRDRTRTNRCGRRSRNSTRTTTTWPCTAFCLSSSSSTAVAVSSTASTSADDASEGTFRLRVGKQNKYFILLKMKTIIHSIGQSKKNDEKKKKKKKKKEKRGCISSDYVPCIYTHAR